MSCPIRIDNYSKLLLQYLPNIKELVIIFSEKTDLQFGTLINIGLIRKIPVSLRLICLTSFSLLEKGADCTPIFSNPNTFLDLKYLGDQHGIEILKKFERGSLILQCQEMKDLEIQFQIEVPMNLPGVKLSII